MGADLRGQLQAALGTRFTIERELEGGGMSPDARDVVRRARQTATRLRAVP
jgi:hypothetical protein